MRVISDISYGELDIQKLDIRLPDGEEFTAFVYFHGGGLVNGNEVKMVLKAGDKVIVGKYTGTEVKLDGFEYTVVSESDVLAVVE